MGRYKNNCSGFTLVELSIVLVIIGLVIGGVLVGQDLINAARIRSQISQIEKYQTAVNTFKIKYGYLPGDITNPAASGFGFSARGNCMGNSPCHGEGDGDGIIKGYCNFLGCIPATVVVWEPYIRSVQAAGETKLFWNDLATSGLIEGKYQGTAETWSAETKTSSPSLNDFYPQAKIGDGYVVVWSGGFNGADNYNYFNITGVNFVNAQATHAYPNLTVLQAYNIDNKVDDGLPQAGNVTANMLFYLGSVEYASGSVAGSIGGYNLYSPGAADSSSTTGTQYTCFDNGGVAGTQKYSISSAADNKNCALSFRFQ